MPETEAVMSEDLKFLRSNWESLTWGNAARYFHSNL
jgi:hypothetical protein